MASYQGHLTVSSILGAVYGSVGALGLDLDWGPVFLGAGLTALGGLLPDLDSDSSVPVRELFSLLAAVVPFVVVRRLRRAGIVFETEELIVIAILVYVLVRFGLARVFKSYTVHRGMFHSIPAMGIAGLVVFFFSQNPIIGVRLYLAGGVMLGFLSHLLLDELYSVDFMGNRVRPNKYAGSAFKFSSPSWSATVTTYVLLTLLAYLASRELFPVAPAG